MHDEVRQELQRYVPLQFLIAGQPDNAHAAATKNPDQRVASKNFLPTSKAADSLPEVKFFHELPASG
jgi:hypothetical protein